MKEPKTLSAGSQKWFKKRFKPSENPKHSALYFFCDEFTNFNDAEIGKKAVMLLDKLGFEVIYQVHEDCGRPQLSKGLLDQAKRLAEANVELFSDLITEETMVVSISHSGYIKRTL